MSNGHHPPPNTLGKVSLLMGVPAVCSGFCMGLRAGVGSDKPLAVFPACLNALWREAHDTLSG